MKITIGQMIGLLIAVMAYLLSTLAFSVEAASKHEIRVSGTQFLLNDKPFPYTGISFFNAIYNPQFNKSSRERREWLRKFQRYGVNVLRVWCQWDNQRGFADAAASNTMYHADGRVNEQHLQTLRAILNDTDAEGMVIELALFSQESWRENIRLSPKSMDIAVESVARELLPHRNLTLQIWNELSERVLESVKIIKAVDPKRLVTNSPGVAGYLGDPPQNQALDYLTPHTSRQNAGNTWEVAPRELGYLLARYKKPVVDDEPARNGTGRFGGPKEATSPYDHILHTFAVWQTGAYVTYHHDMFQTGYGTPAVPPSGIPDPEFSSYHQRVLEFIALRERYTK